ncbi:MAG TPA: inositol monophosphatase family protein [Buchnera sp. (in: enterobacteria)]|nr:inositol monophosphatase family protein [Buchnera sp. (in: enterobacteria)]
MHPMLNIAVRAARKGGSIITHSYDIQNKTMENQHNSRNNIISNMMKNVHKSMIEIIHKAYPDHYIYTINAQDNILQDTRMIWIINILDGINNFKKKFPHFCISIVVLIKNKTELSVIYDPLRNELFTAVKGQGAQLNGYRMRCSEVNSIDNSTIGINLPNNIEHHVKYDFKIIQLLISQGINIICSGSTVLDLAYLSTGRLDGILHYTFQKYNVFAGALQIRESGGIISELTGDCYDYLNSNTIFSSNSKLLRLLISITRQLQ